MVSQVAKTDIEAELSYAYLHAIASRAGAECTYSGRLSDNRGIDARLTYWSAQPHARKEVDIKVQLKATIKSPPDKDSHLSFSLENNQYNDLRADGAYAVPRILVVLFLPNADATWLDISDSRLVMQRAAYWVSLRGAKEPTTGSHTTVYLPKEQLLTPPSLEALFNDLAFNRVPAYTPPEVKHED